ncbi:unnamed protein product [Strongylus vulgaris]|uniref:Uncharacterized protein n=1 Tax=Strongylus vulgaris TaxID=40348 RepID=A0A3P7ITL9_STRVU|nr:unnamed protein product [Strongylus vulgaris]
MISASIALGIRLNLFNALAKVGSEDEPATAEQVAEESGCKERYVREWLAVMGTADIITVTKDEKFFIKRENIEDLTTSTDVYLHSLLPNSLRPYDKLCEVFKKEGPYGNPHSFSKVSEFLSHNNLGLDYSDFSVEFYEVMANLRLDYSDFSVEFYEVMANLSEAMHKKHLITDFLPALGSNIKERLEEAENYPKSNFIGIDVTLEAVHMANQKRKDDGKTYDNLAFIQMDGGHMDADWTEKFDLVIIFDACHDQRRPDLVRNE